MNLYLKAVDFSQRTAKRTKEILKNPKGMTMVEIIVLISVILVIATVLFIFRGQIIDFIDRAGEQVDGLAVS